MAQSLSNSSRAKAVVPALIALAIGYTLPFLLKSILPPSEPSYPYIAIAASFALNLASLALALAFLPDESDPTQRPIFRNSRAWLRTIVCIAFAFGGLWAAPFQKESPRIFLALALLTSVQAGALFAVHAGLTVFLGTNNRAPKTICALLLSVLVSALFWSREPIERLTKIGGKGSQQSAQFVDIVMKFSPPMSVASAWYLECDGARATGIASPRRFDLVHGPLTYAVWIGSYQSVASPDILPSGGTGDFYSHDEFKPGIVLIFLLWALPILAFCDLLLWRKRVATASSVAYSSL